MRWLGVDLGKVRIGVAVADDATQLIRPLPQIIAKGALSKDAGQVIEVAKSEDAEGIVLGLPLDAGEETPMSKVVRRFGEILSESGWQVDYVDESLTSFEADSQMFESGIKASQRKRNLDSQAACLILERWMQNR
ncbi:MAG: Holliday junction resolvase RuvX [Armatimonadetes bacterium]|nr:Holliday junction resolvase RuvX [Armatimonadota bacterium]